MRFNRNIFLAFFVFATFITITSCCKKAEPLEENTGKLRLNFDVYNGANPQEYLAQIYTNAAGNNYQVWNVQYFITRLTLYKDGVPTVLNGWQNEHYYDNQISQTFSWPIVDPIPTGTYDSLAFTFGFKDVDNIDYMFVNPPENQMVWTDRNGGGYHYMKIDGKWEAPNGLLRSFAFHIGRGQIYDVNGDITGYIDNSFEIVLPNSSVTITANTTKEVTLRMHLDQWFTNPEDYDHNQFGGDIMENQVAMAKGCRNGWNVFSLEQ